MTEKIDWYDEFVDLVTFRRKTIDCLYYFELQRHERKRAAEDSFRSLPAMDQLNKLRAVRD